MAITVYRLNTWEGTDLNRISERITGRVRRDYYQVDGLTNVDDLAAAFAAGLPGPFQAAHSDDTIVRDVTRVAVLNSNAADGTSCIFSVDSSANYSTPQYRRMSRLEMLEPDTKFGIPNFTRRTGATGGDVWFENVPVKLDMGRLRSRRIDEKVVTGVTPEDVQAFDAVNHGTWTTINGVIYLYLGTTGWFGQDGFGLVRSIYETSARVKAFPVNIVPGWDLAIPALPNKANYHVGRTATGVPVVSVVRLQDMTDPMQSIPW